MAVQDIRAILRLTHEQGLSVREVGLRLKLSKTTATTYLHRAREAGLNCWPLPSGRNDDATLKQVLFQRVGRPPRDLSKPDWPKMAGEMKRKGVTLVLLWEEYRAAHPDGYGYTWFCERYRAFENRISPRYRNRHEAGAVMQTDYAGHTIAVFDPGTGAEHRAQIFVAVLGASNYTFAWASLSQKLPDWIEATGVIQNVQSPIANEDDTPLAERLRQYLKALPSSHPTVSYGTLTRACGLWRPGSVRKVTQALEDTMRDDAGAGHPFIAARAIGRASDGLPGKGFFDLARDLSRGPRDGETERAFHARELQRLEQATN